MATKVTGYELTIWVDDDKYNQLKQQAKNENTTVDLLVEELINEKIKTDNNINNIWDIQHEHRQELIDLIQGYASSVSLTDEGLARLLEDTKMDINHLVYALLQIAEDSIRDDHLWYNQKIDEYIKANKLEQKEMFEDYSTDEFIQIVNFFDNLKKENPQYNYNYMRGQRLLMYDYLWLDSMLDVLSKEKSESDAQQIIQKILIKGARNRIQAIHGTYKPTESDNC